MKKRKRGFLVSFLCLVFLIGAGIEPGKSQSASGPPVHTVIQPPQEVDPARQQLVEQLKSYRKSGDRVREAAIWRLLDPSLSFVPEISPAKPSDIIFAQGTEGPSPRLRLEWINPDIPVFNLDNHETHPVMDFVRSGSNYPMIVAACVRGDSGGLDKISLKASSDQGTTWTAASQILSSVDMRLGIPTIKQTKLSEIGLACLAYPLINGPFLWFFRLSATNLDELDWTFIDEMATMPCLTSDVEDNPEPYQYLVYYQTTYWPDVNPGQPYRYDLLFTRSTDGGIAWSSRMAVARFWSASSEVPVYCSIDYEDDTLYLAYIGDITRDIRVKRSTDYGSSWSDPSVLRTGNVFEPEVAVGDSTHAIVMYTSGLYPDQSPQYYYTNDFTTWNFGTLSSSYDNENAPVVRHYGGRYYAAIRNQDSNEIWIMNAPIHSPPPFFQGTWQSVKNSSNGVSTSDRAVSLIAKPGPSDVVGSAAVWVEDTASADVYFDGNWQPLPQIRTPIKDIVTGSVGLGEAVDVTTRIYNDGNGPLTVGSIGRSGSTCFTYQGPATPFTISGGGSTLITVRFAPNKLGQLITLFTVNSDDPDTPATAFSATGWGAAPAVAPDIRTPIANFDFGTVLIGNTMDGGTTLYNDGGETLTINAITRLSGSTEFTYVGPALPFNITAGGSREIALRFAPATVGSKSAVFQVNSNDPDEASVTFNVMGTGSFWTPAKRLTWNSGESYRPRVAVDSSGHLHLAWYDSTPGNFEIYYEKSTDGGATWTAGKRLTSTAGASESPAIAAGSSGSLNVVWVDKTPGNFEIFYIKSTDGGATWKASNRLTSNAGTSASPAIVVGSSNKLHVVWEDNTPGNYEIYHRKSTDGGATWSTGKRLTWTSGHSRSPAISIDTFGSLHMVWHDNTPGNYEIYHRKSTDGGSTWSTSKRLTWTTGSSESPAITAYSSGKFYIVWKEYTAGDFEIYHKKSTDGGATWSTNKRLTWTLGESRSPAISIDSAGNLHLVWDDGTSGNFEIYYKESTDGGATWSTSRRFTWNSGISRTAAIASDPPGNLHVVWFDNTPGNYEIFYKKGK